MVLDTIFRLLVASLLYSGVCEAQNQNQQDPKKWVTQSVFILKQKEKLDKLPDNISILDALVERSFQFDKCSRIRKTYDRKKTQNFIQYQHLFYSI